MFLTYRKLIRNKNNIEKENLFCRLLGIYDYFLMDYVVIQYTFRTHHSKFSPVQSYSAKSNTISLFPICLHPQNNC